MIYIIIGLAVVLLILLVIYFYYEDFKLQVTRYSFKSNRIKKKLKIIQISDFHNEKNKWLHRQIVDIIKREKPDLIVITGDLIDKDDNKYSDILLSEIEGICDIYFVPGNHEYIFEGYSKLLEVLHKHNVKVLENKCADIGNNIDLYGIKDPIFGGIEDEEKTLNEYLDCFKLNDKKYNILLSHRPEHFSSYCDRNYDLVLTGHAHGGQFIIPPIGSIYSPHQGLFPKYARGIHKKNKTNMIVSRGLGNSLYAIIRINNRPELIIVSLSK